MSSSKTKEPLSPPVYPESGMPFVVKVSMFSAFFVVALRAYHAWTVAVNTGSMPLHLFAVFLVCASISIGLLFRCSIARHAIRFLAACGMIFFTLGIIYIAYQLLRGTINPPLWLLLFTLLNPATAYVLFFSLGSNGSKKYFSRSAKVSCGIAASVSLVLGVALTASLYYMIQFCIPKEHVVNVDAIPSITFEVREASQQPVAGFSEMINKRTGEIIFVDPQVAFSNKDLRSASVVEQPDGDGQSMPIIVVSFTEEAAKEFASFTARYIPPAYAVPVGSLRSVAILIDGEVWFAPVIREPVTGGRCFIPFGFGTKEDAVYIAKGMTGR